VREARHIEELCLNAGRFKKTMQGPLENQDFREIIEEYDNSIVVGAGITGVW